MASGGAEQPKPLHAVRLADGALLVSYEGSKLKRIGADGEQSEVNVGASDRFFSILTADIDGSILMFRNGQVLVGSLGSDPMPVAHYDIADPVHPERRIDDITAGAIDASGHLVVCDSLNRRILRVRLPGSWS